MLSIIVASALLALSIAGPFSGALLVMLGLRIRLLAEAPDEPNLARPSASGDYLTGLSIALCTPATINGVFFGSLACYALLSYTPSALQSRISKSALKRLNLFSGTTLIPMGLSISVSSVTALHPNKNACSAAHDATLEVAR